MTETLAESLYTTLRQYSITLVTTPRMFETFLTRRTKVPADELTAVMAAIEHGAVNELLEHTDADLAAMATALAERTGLPVKTARWSLELWQLVIHHLKSGTPPPQSQWQVPEPVPPVSAFRRGLFAVMLVAMVGGIAGALPGVLVAVGIQRESPRALKFRQIFERHEATGTRMTPRELATWTGTLGGLGGLIGGGLGWMAGGFGRVSTLRVLGAASGALWAFDGAVFGALCFGMVGLLFGSLIAAAIMTLIAILMGRFAFVLLGKQIAWFVFPHF